MTLTMVGEAPKGNEGPRKGKGIQPGDRAPDFTLLDQENVPTRLQDQLGKGPLIVYFYPKDETPGCVAEACLFRDHYSDFQSLGAEVFGISSDSPDTHRAFCKHHRIPFRLLSDPGGKVRSLWGVPKTLRIFPGRVTYVLDAEGIVRHVVVSQSQPRKHLEEALKVIRQMPKADTVRTTFTAHQD